MAIAALGVVIAGFGARFYSSQVDAPPLTPRVLAHGALFGTWVLLFVAQTTLIAIGRRAIHRRLGIATAVVATGMILSGPLLAIGLARRGGPPGTDPLAFLLVLVADIALFAVFVGGALIWRRRPEMHKRLMLLGMINVLPAAITRWPIAVTSPGPFVGGTLLAFIVAMIVQDLVVRRRPHPATIWGGLILLVSLPVRFAAAQTTAWHHFAAWLIR
jgi:hypothetical protein